MAEQDLDLLLGRLAVHYKILSKDQAQQAIKLWRATQSDMELGQFLVQESYVAADTLPKLLRARTEYLRRKGMSAEPMTPLPVAPQPGLPQPEMSQPELPQPADGPQVGATTVRLTPDMLAAAGAGPQLPEPGAPEPGAPQPTVAIPMSTQALPPEPAATDLPPVAPELPTPEAPPLDLLAPDTQAETQPLASELPPQLATPEVGTPDVVPADASAPEVAAEGISADTPPPAPEPQEADLLSYSPGDTLEELLRRACELGASDLHVHSGAPLKIRLNGQLQDASPVIDRVTAEELIYGVLAVEQREALEKHLQLDFSFEISGVGRFRSNSYFQHHGPDAVMRIVPPEPPTLEQLGLPETLNRFADYHQGMVLFTGPAGCGKSSTMAALVRVINENRPEHILSIEDPIEYVHTPQLCVVNQREVGPHTESFARALRAALREDPDIIVIGELRDLETISLALTAAETGHLVLATLHTGSTIPTINRLVGVFPPDQQAQIRTMVSESLRAIVSQRLVPRADGQGRSPALEILVNNKAIGNLIRENRTFQIKSILQTGGTQGMCELDSSLAELVKQRVITKETAKREALEPKRFA